MSKKIIAWILAAIKDILVTIKLDWADWRSTRLAVRVNALDGYYTDGSPMADEDMRLYRLLDKFAIGGLAVLLVAVTIVITLGIVGR